MSPHLELPAEKVPAERRAVRLEWLTIAYMASAIAFLALTLGQSQAMKAAWIEDMLSLLPPAAFLIATRMRKREPNPRFPWGYHGATSIAYLAAATALLVLGGYVLVDSVLKLVLAERPPIGAIEVFGEELWLGWAMLVALAWSAFPAVLLGRAKLPLADELHDKVLYADAHMNRADWMTASAAMVGVIAIGFGLWWADAVAAIFISLDIVRDGWRNLRAAVSDLMGERPSTYDLSGSHPLLGRIQEELEGLDWVREARVRLREEGHVFAGDAHVVPVSDDGLVERIEEATERLHGLDWKLHDFSIVPCSDLRDVLAEHGVDETRAGY